MWLSNNTTLFTNIGLDLASGPQFARPGSNGIEHPEIEPTTYGNLVHDKSGISNHWGTF